MDSSDLHQMTNITASAQNSFPVLVTAEDKCVDSWSVHRDTTVDGPIMWQGVFTLASCILKCLRDNACLAVTYLWEERKCNYVRMASVLRLRRQTDAQTTLVIIDSRCPGSL